MRALFALLCLIALSCAFAAPHQCTLADNACPNPATQICVGLESGNGFGTCLSVLGGSCFLASDCAFGLTCSRGVCVTSGGCGQIAISPNSPCTASQVCLVVGGSGFCETVTGGLGSPCLVGTNFTLKATMSGACASGFTCVGLAGEIGACAALCAANPELPGTLPSAGAVCLLSSGVLTGGMPTSTTGTCVSANLEIVGSPLSPEFVCLAANAFSPFCVVNVGSSIGTPNPLCTGTQICVGEPGVGFGVCESGALGSPCFAGGEPCHAGLACLVDNPSTDFGHCERASSSFFEGAMCDLNTNDPNSLNCGTGTGNPSLICVGFDDQGVCVKSSNLNKIAIQGTTCSQGATPCTFNGNQCGPCGACLNGSSLACSSADSACFCSCDVSSGGGSLLGSMCSAPSSMMDSTWWTANMPSNMEPVASQEQCGFCVQISASGQPLQTACVASVNLFDMDDVCFRDEGRSDFQNQMWDMSGQHSKDFDFCRAQFCHPESGLCVRGKKGEQCPMDDPDCCPGTCEDDGKGQGNNMCVRDCNQNNGNKGGGKGGNKGGGKGPGGKGPGGKGPGGNQGQCPENNCYPNRVWENGQCNMGDPMDCSQFWSSGMIQQMGMHEECFSMECDENQGFQCMPNYSGHDGNACSQDASMTGQTCKNGQCQGGTSRCDASQGWSWNPNAGRNGNGACTRHMQGPGQGGPGGPGNKNGGQPGGIVRRRVGGGNKNGNNGNEGGSGNKNGNQGSGNKNGNNGKNGNGNQGGGGPGNGNQKGPGNGVLVPCEGSDC